MSATNRKQALNELLDKAFAALQHDTGPQDPEYVYLRNQLEQGFGRVLDALVAPPEAVPTSRELDLAMMMRRLAYKIKIRSRTSPDAKVADGAMDLLRRMGLEGSPLRDEECMNNSRLEE